MGGTLAVDELRATGVDPAGSATLVEAWKARASNAFNLGGLLGCFAAIPLAVRFGRKPMFISYFLASAAAIGVVFGLPWSPSQRILGLFVIGLPVYGVFSTYVFYLPELFPTRLRGLGAGLSFNIGRLLAAAGPFVVGTIAARAGGNSQVIMDTLLWVALVPVCSPRCSACAGSWKPATCNCRTDGACQLSRRGLASPRRTAGRASMRSRQRATAGQASKLPMVGIRSAELVQG